MQTLSITNISELPSAAKEILSYVKGKKIFCFYGELGAGKTTLIKELCKILGVKDSGSSPTYGLVNEYHLSPPELRSQPSVVQKGEGQSQTPNHTNTSPWGRTGGVIYHFDFYRIKSEAEAFDLGFEEYLDSGNYCFIEWPEKIQRLLPTDYLKVKIEVKEGERIISIS